MVILLTDDEVKRTISKYYGVSIEFVDIDDNGFYGLTLPEGLDITIKGCDE